MSGDYRFFIKVHNGFPEHPKTGGLSDRAFRNLIELWCYCSRNLTDGKVTKPHGNKILSRKSREELITAGYLLEHATEYEMRDYLEHQMSAAQVADLREKRAAAGRRGGHAKANHMASATANPKQTASKPVADKDVDIDKDQKTTTTEQPSSATPKVRSKYTPAFEAFWNSYPRKVGKDSALKAWTQALRSVDEATIIAGVRDMISDPNLPEVQFIPHPTTWLRRGGWNDAPYPPPRTSNGRVAMSTGEERAMAAVNAAQQVIASREGYAQHPQIGA